MRINKMLGAGLVALLLASMVIVTGSSPWDGVPDDPTPAQAIWVDPKNTTGVGVSDTFVVDVLVNITDPDPLHSPPDTLYAIEYKLKWNNTILDVVEIDTHGDTVADAPAGWNSPFVAANTTLDLGNGFDEHFYATGDLYGPGMVGVYSFCTYTFRAMGNGNCTLDIYNDKLVDDSATYIPHTTVDGHVTISTPANTIWVDPKFTTDVDVGDTFVVDVMVNITDPDPLNSPPDTLYAIEYKLKWSNTMLDVVGIETHGDTVDDAPAGWDNPFVAVNTISDLGNGFDEHYYATVTLSGPGMVGVYSFCTYTFRAMSYGECTLDIYDDKLTDDYATLIPHTTADGHVTIGLSPTPAQAIWVNPKNTTGVSVSDTFVVDVLVNITDPDPLNSPPDTLYGFEYKLKWNSTILEVVEIQTHTDDIPSGDRLPGWDSIWVATNQTTSNYHYYAVAAMSGPGFTGVASLCTYTFRAMSNGECTLDIYDDKLVDDFAMTFAHTTVDGCVIVGRAPVVQHFPVTWKWFNGTEAPGFPVWLTANVTLSIIHSVTNFSFNRSLGQISFEITSLTQRTCNVTVPKLLMDGAFKVLIDDMQTPSILTWNESHTFVHFTYSQGIHNIKIIGEIVTRLRGIDFLSIADVNGDGIVDIVDIVTLALRFGWEEDC